MVDVIFDIYFLAEITGISSVTGYFRTRKEAHFCIALRCFLGSVFLGILLNNTFRIKYITEPTYYTSLEIKGAGDEGRKFTGSRVTGVLYTCENAYLIFNTLYCFDFQVDVLRRICGSQIQIESISFDMTDSHVIRTYRGES